MGRLFGTNGVRGLVGKEITPEVMTRISSSSGSILGKRIAVGRDGRTSSPMLMDAAVSGLLSVGCDVVDLGVIPTPALQWLVKHYELDGGLMITASHNPPQFNGVKVMAGDGVEISRETENIIEDIFFLGGPKLSAWDQVGSISQMDLIKDYIEAIVSKVDLPNIRKACFKVAIDPGNGVGTLVAPEIARRLGCEVYTVNADLDGRFLGRESEPRPDNLDSLKALVEATKSDLGIAFDGDADRSIFLDEQGIVLWGDRSFALVASWYMGEHPGSRVVTPVSSSRAIMDVVAKAGGNIRWTKVGSVDVSRTMVEEGIDFGGEENGGVMYGPHHPVRDGSMTMAIILGIMAKRNVPLSKLIDELPLYAQAKDKIGCPNELKQRVLEDIAKRVDAVDIDTMDGLKMSFSDGSWILVRPSGTEPIFRLYAEAFDQARVKDLVSKYKLVVKESVSRFNV